MQRSEYKPWSIKLCSWLILVSGMLMLVACKKSNKEDINVLLLWPTSENDYVFRKWTEIATEEFDRQGFNATLSLCYAGGGINPDTTEVKNIVGTIHALAKEERAPQLILSHGDYLHWLLNLTNDSLLASIPTVCFGLSDPLHHEETIPENYRRVHIICPIDLQKNLDFADFISNLRAPGDSLNWTGNKQRHRFCTLLDPVANCPDAERFDKLMSLFDTLKSNRYYNNFFNDIEEDSLQAMADEGCIVFSCRSLHNPNFNIAPGLKQQVHNKWAFYPQMSPNYFIQVKHDDISRNCTEGPNFLPFFTMVAEDFLTNDSCIGGYFATPEQMIHDAIATGKRLLAGERPKSIGTQRHAMGYHVNWNILRSKGLYISQIHKDIEIHNEQYLDRHPRVVNNLFWFITVALIVLLIIIVLYSRYSIRTHRGYTQKYHKQAQRAIQSQQILHQTLEQVGAVSWSESEDENSLLKRLELNSFYRERLTEFLHNTKAGRYSMQLQASVDGQAVHWYDLRMLVTHPPYGAIKRQGILVNIDQQKELESKSLEAHRLLMNAKTREGFIASMHHELRTPLNAIVGFAQVLAMPGVKNTPEELEICAESIHSNAALLRKEINDLLLVTLMNNSTIAAQCQTMLMINQMKPELWKDAISLTMRRHNTVNIEHGPAGANVYADPKMLATVMENLIDNASKFSDEGSAITIGWNIDMASESNADGKRWIEIWVRDEGIGIDPKHHEMIFNRFFKVQSFVPGCGLGLFITKTYVELMGGGIRVESELDKGTTFYVRLRG